MFENFVIIDPFRLVVSIKVPGIPINRILAVRIHSVGVNNLVIVDTAGRDALSDELIEELNGINDAVKADNRLLVIGADVGQAAEKQAQAFHDTCGVTGVIITKLDGTAKGGGALIACAVTEAPVMFVGVGEKTDAFEEFRPKGGHFEMELEQYSRVEVEMMQVRIVKGDGELEISPKIKTTSLGTPLSCRSAHPGAVHLAWPVNCIRSFRKLASTASAAEGAKQLFVPRFKAHLAPPSLVKLLANTSVGREVPSKSSSEEEE